MSIYCLVLLYILVLLSVCDINSNILIQSKQFLSFVKCIGGDDNEIAVAAMFLAGEEYFYVYNRHKDKCVELKTCKTFLSRNSTIFKNIYVVRDAVIVKVITPKRFNEILLRKGLYDRYGGKKPKETFCSCLYRITFQNRPSPYHTDFRKDNSGNYSYDYFATCIRRLYGYASRKSINYVKSDSSCSSKFAEKSADITSENPSVNYSKKSNSYTNKSSSYTKKYNGSYTKVKFCNGSAKNNKIFPV